MKMTHHIPENNHVVNSWLLFANNGDQMAVEEIFKVLKEKKKTVNQ